MEQNLNSEKTAARASQQAVEHKAGEAGDGGDHEQKKLDEVGMKAAKRAGNRFREDETTVPGSTPFTK